MTRIHDTWADNDNPLTIEIYYSSAWHDITSGLSEDGIDINQRGRADWSGSSDPTEMSLTLDNEGGTYSPRNPNSALFGLINRNTPIRAWVNVGSPFLRAETTGRAAMSDTAAISVTGDIEIICDGDSDDWTAVGLLVWKWDAGSNNRSYSLGVTPSARTLDFSWSTNGTNENTLTSTATLPSPSGRYQFKASFDVSTGGNHEVTFYYNAGAPDGWTQLGDPVSGSGTTSIYDGAAELAVRVSNGVMYSASVIDGIGGTTVASPTFTDQADGDTSFSDGQANSWTVYSPGLLHNRHYRYSGEVVAWPQRWTLKGVCLTNIQCAGVTRRLGQGQEALESAYTRGCRSVVAPVTGLVGYWPMEDAVGASEVASGLPGGTPMEIYGAPTLANDSSFACSAALPKLTSGASFDGHPNSHTPTGDYQVWFLMKIPDSGISGRLALIATSGTAPRWDVTLDSSGNITLTVSDSSLSTITTDGPNAFDVNGRTLRFGLSMSQSGSDIDYAIAVLETGAGIQYSSSGTISSRTVGTFYGVSLAPGGTLADAIVGQCTIQTTTTSVFYLSGLLNANSGETADGRINRLCEEQDIASETIGIADDTQRLGTQDQTLFLDLLTECEAVDLGMLCESRTSHGLRYRMRRDICAQAPGVTIPYTDNLLLPFHPVDDDQHTRNKIGITRKNGTSTTVEVTSGPLNTSAPEDDPEGVGTYGEDLTLSLAYDTQVEGQASWRAHLGTVDEARWPQIGVELAHPTFVADPDLTMQILNLDVGDRIVVTDVPDFLPPFDVDQVIVGYSETITPTRYTIVFNCVPYSPYRTGIWDDPDSRYSAEGTVLAENLTTTETGIDITAPTDIDWTHADGDYDIIIGGEIMTVTGISGTSPSFTLTVTRSANGVVKTHTTGAAVELAAPVYYNMQGG